MKAVPSELLAGWAHTLRRCGERPALTDAATGATTSFRALEAAAEAEAERFAAAFGPVRGRLVVFARPNGAAWFAALLAVRKLGGLAVALEPGGPPAHAQALAGRLGAAGLVLGDACERLPGRRRFARPGLCLLKLTSGSTGGPRALAFTDAEMLADGRQIAATMGIRSLDTNYALLPFGHSYGLGNLVFPLLAQGTAAVCGTVPLPHVVAGEIRAFHPTVWPTVPAVLRALAASEVPADALAPLRLVISAGSFLPPEVARDFHARFGRTVHNFYGSSETGGIAYDRGGAATLSGRAVGRPLRGVRLRLAPGGRVAVTSAAAFSLGNRRGPGQVLLADHGRLESRGELVLLGRAGRFAKIAGRRIGFGEVELALRALEGVEQVFVTALPGPEPILAAAVQSARPAAELRAALQLRLPHWKVPKRLVCWPLFPLTPRGKPDPAALTAGLGRRRDQLPA